MEISLIRRKDEMKDVLMEPLTNGPEISYWVLNNPGGEKWKNITVLAPGKFGREYNKTYGHYHISNQTEMSRLLHGKGVYLLQKRDGQVFFAMVKPGEELHIPLGFAHAWINVGNDPLIALDNWTGGHDSHDYATIQQNRGLAYYLIDNDGNPEPVPNPRYKNLPKPWSGSAQEFEKIASSSGLSTS